MGGCLALRVASSVGPSVRPLHHHHPKPLPHPVNPPPQPKKQTHQVSNLYFLSQLLHKRFSGNILVRLLGRWQEVEGQAGYASVYMFACSCVGVGVYRPGPSVYDDTPPSTQPLSPQTPKLHPHPRQSVPVGGIAYYISPPHSLAEIIADPFHALFYLVFILASCALFSKTWIEVSGACLLSFTQCRGGGDFLSRRW